MDGLHAFARHIRITNQLFFPFLAFGIWAISFPSKSPLWAFLLAVPIFSFISGRLVFPFLSSPLSKLSLLHLYAHHETPHHAIFGTAACAVRNCGVCPHYGLHLCRLQPWLHRGCRFAHGRLNRRLKYRYANFPAQHLDDWHSQLRVSNQQSVLELKRWLP
jgi:hypothetical protein